MNKIFNTAALVTLFSPMAIAMGETVLGVPFGEKLSVAQCPVNTDDAESPCWVGKPFIAKDGTRTGYVHLPFPDRRPAWAAYGLFQLHIDKADRVQEVKANIFKASARLQIAESISARFGTPKEIQLNKPDAGWASWKTDSAYIEMRCTSECWVEFRTPSAQARHELELAQRAKIDRARPVSP